MGGNDRDGIGKLFNRSNSRIWIFVAMAAVSIAAILIKLSTSHPLAIAAWRLLIADSILLPFFIWTIRSERFTIGRKRFFQLGLVGLALALHFAMWIWSFQMTRVSSSVVLVTTHPLFVAIISVSLFNEKLNAKAVLGMIIALAGSFLLIAGDLTMSFKTLTGNLLALGGAVMAGIYILAGSRFRKDISLPGYAFIVYLWAALFLLIAIFVGGVRFLSDSPTEYLILFGLAAGPMLAGHTIYNWALRYVSPTFVSVSLLGEPVGSTILAVLILAEMPGWGAIIGGPIVLFGIYLVARNTR
ncbi:MAG: DMT family transporter [Candidatus Thermoplasmatota archaeon]|nr:DMT family transporter [Candidatus Thermoplasmatota archaeon]